MIMKFLFLQLISLLIFYSCLPIINQPPENESHIEVKLEQILKNVEETRGLTRTEDIPVNFLSREKFERKLTKELLTLGDEEYAYKEEILLQTLNLIESDVNLFDLLTAMYLENILGFYDTETKEVYLITESETITPLLELTLAHEFAHALQQQHFDIRTLSEKVKGNNENETSLLALIEGDAVHVELKYLDDYLNKKDRKDVLKNVDTKQSERNTPVVLEKIMLFPYVDGLSLVENILNKSNLSGLNAAYTRPPTSTEQVIHPDKYFHRETALDITLPNITTLEKQGWNVIHKEVLGEFLLRTYLEIMTSKSTASVASSGWDGDQYQILNNAEGDTILISITKWESPKDTKEFYSALSKINSSTVKIRFAISTFRNEVLLVFGANTETYENIIQSLNQF